MNKKTIAAEMARRKIRFHKNEKWDKIRLWGLFGWGDVSRLLNSGELKTHMKKENKTIWVTPNTEFWENEIKPLIEKHTLEELETLAGW